jgi:hypothetical protein
MKVMYKALVPWSDGLVEIEELPDATGIPRKADRCPCGRLDVLTDSGKITVYGAPQEDVMEKYARSVENKENSVHLSHGVLSKRCVMKYYNAKEEFVKDLNLPEKCMPDGLSD